MSSKTLKCAAVVASIISASAIGGHAYAENCSNYKARADALEGQYLAAITARRSESETLRLRRRSDEAWGVYSSCKNRNAQAAQRRQPRALDVGKIIDFSIGAFGALGGGGGSGGGHNSGQHQGQ